MSVIHPDQSIVYYVLRTVPDTQAGAMLYGFDGLDDKSAAKAMFHMQKQQTGNDQLPIYLQSIAVITLCRLKADTLDFQQFTAGSIKQERNLLEQVNQYFCYDNERENIKGTPELNVLLTWPETAMNQDIKQGMHHLLNARNFKHLQVSISTSEVILPALDGLNSEQEKLDSSTSLLNLPGIKLLNHHDIWKYYRQGKLEPIIHDAQQSLHMLLLMSLREKHLGNVINQSRYQDLLEKIKKAVHTN